MARILKGRYRRAENKHFRITQGRMSEGFLVTDTADPSRPVRFVKRLIQESLSAVEVYTRRQLFDREADFLKTLDGCNGCVPRFIDYFGDRAEQYLVMEWIDGRTLKKIIDEGLVTEDIVRNVLSGILRLLRDLHLRGIVHQDIKPANIIVRSGTNAPVLVDFGIARYKNQPDSIPPLATRTFAPREQQEGRPEFNSDLYALALTAVYALTKTHPKNIGQLKNEVCCQLEWPRCERKLFPVLRGKLVCCPREFRGPG